MGMKQDTNDGKGDKAMKRDIEIKFNDDVCICGNQRKQHPTEDRMSTCLGFFFYRRSDKYTNDLWNKVHQLVEVA